METGLKQRFEQDGFVVARQFLSAEEMAEIRAGWDRFVRDIAPTLDKRLVLYEDYQNPDTLKQSNALHLEPTLDALRFGGRIHGLAESLIGPVAPQQAEFFDKPPGKNQPTPAHQDGYYFCIRPNVGCTVWIPLDPVDESNGALTYVRGSHRLGVRDHRGSSILGFSQGLVEDPASLGEPVLCPVEPGDVLAHHSLTVHFAGPNRSSRRRRAIGYVFFSAAATRDDEAWARYQFALQRQHEGIGIA